MSIVSRPCMMRQSAASCQDPSTSLISSGATQRMSHRGISSHGNQHTTTSAHVLARTHLRFARAERAAILETCKPQKFEEQAAANERPVCRMHRARTCIANDGLPVHLCAHVCPLLVADSFHRRRTPIPCRHHHPALKEHGVCKSKLNK